MGFWNSFNKIGKSLPETKEVLKIPSHIKETTLNINLNKISVRYFSQNFTSCIETIGEIQRLTSIPIVLFNVPDVKGAVLLIDNFTYINRSRNNELTIDVCENYPYGIDKNSDLLKFKDVQYQNIRDDLTKNIINKSQKMYYQDRKFYIPVMLNQIPIPIIRLDDADRFQPINKKYVKLLANVSQTFIREWIDIKLLQRTGSKNTSGMVYVALMFGIIGIIFGMIIRSFIG